MPEERKVYRRPARTAAPAPQAGQTAPRLDAPPPPKKKKRPGAKRRRSRLVLGLCLLCLLIVVTGVQMVISQYQLGQETANMQWPEWIYGSFVPVGAAFAAIAFLQTMVQMYKDYRAEEGK